MEYADLKLQNPPSRDHEYAESMPKSTAALRLLFDINSQVILPRPGEDGLIWSYDNILHPRKPVLWFKNSLLTDVRTRRNLCLWWGGPQGMDSIILRSLPYSLLFSHDNHGTDIWFSWFCFTRYLTLSELREINKMLREYCRLNAENPSCARVALGAESTATPIDSTEHAAFRGSLRCKRFNRVIEHVGERIEPERLIAELRSLTAKG